MKITKRQFRRIIKRGIEDVLDETLNLNEEVEAGLKIRQDLGAALGGQQVAIGSVVTTGRTKPPKGLAPGKIQISWKWKSPNGEIRNGSRWVPDDLPNLFIKKPIAEMY